MLELLAIVWHIFEALLGFLDMASIVFDIYSWTRGRGNRLERKAAKQLGHPVPKPDKWYWYVVASTVVTIILSGFLLYKYSQSLSDTPIQSAKIPTFCIVDAMIH